MCVLINIITKKSWIVDKETALNICDENPEFTYDEFDKQKEGKL